MEVDVEIVIGKMNGEIDRLNTANGQIRRSISAYPRNEVAALALSPDGKTIASSRTQMSLAIAFGVQPEPGRESIQFWDAASGSLVKEVVSDLEIKQAIPHRGGQVGFTQLVFSPDGLTLAATHRTGLVYCWNTSTGRQFFQFPGKANSFCFSPDGNMVVTVAGDEIRLIELASGQPCLAAKLLEPSNVSLNGLFLDTFPVGRISAQAISPDGASLAVAAAEDNSISIWPLAPAGWKGPSDRAPAAEQLAGLWDRLAADNATDAYSAIWQMASGGESVVRFLQSKITAVAKAPDRAQRVRALIENLDSTFADIREKSASELAEIGADAEPQIRAALAKAASDPRKKQLEDILARLKSARPHQGESLRTLRAIRVLDRIGGEQAADVLKALAGGDPLAPETGRAKVALERLQHRAANHANGAAPAIGK